MPDLKPHPGAPSPDMLRLARCVADAGGRALVVGGWVRDRLLGLDPKDYDVEVQGIPLQRLEQALNSLGPVLRVGKSFGVLKVAGTGADVSLPRRDAKTAPGHRGFDVELDPFLPFDRAVLRRDLTVNTLGFDPLTGEVLDPLAGREDLAEGVLRAADPHTFPEDPLRGLRVARFGARLAMRPDPELVDLCRALDLSELPGERLFEEFAGLLLKSSGPSMGFAILAETGMVRHFPELAALRGVAQDPAWHPEGDVWVHTLLALDRAAELRSGERDADLALMFGVLCHDFGKPSTTHVAADGHIRSPEHEPAGEAPARRFMEQLRAPSLLVEQVVMVTRHHLAPAHFHKGPASRRAFRRLARKLGEVRLTPADLERAARADHFGRTTEDAVARSFPAGDAFLEGARAADVEDAPPRDAVLGRHVLARGIAPGPEVGRILARCRELQDETGMSDPDGLLERALAEPGG